MSAGQDGEPRSRAGAGLLGNLDLTLLDGPVDLRLDGWAPRVQGAVGSVAGLVDADGRRYVLKLYRSPTGPERAATEAAALRLLAGGPIPVPRLIGSGELAGVAYVLMSRLPGVRWADRRAGLPDRWSRPLHRDAGRWLRRLHSGSPLGSDERCGSLLPGGPSWPTVRAAAEARGEDLVGRYAQLRRPARVEHRVRHLVEQHASALDAAGPTVLCHNDWVGSNLLVEPCGKPRLLGVVDLERASWGDPMADLAQIWRHAAFHDPAAATELVEAYGTDEEGERARMAVHVALHTLDELIWICTDRPQGWQQSVAALEDQLRAVEPV